MMQNKVNKPRFNEKLSLYAKCIAISMITLILAACGNNHPELTHLKVFDERFSTVLDSNDTTKLSQFSELFHDRKKVTNVQGDLNFVYLFDLTTPSDSERWRCTKSGFCRLQLEGATPNREIFYIERYKELFQMSNLD